MAEINDLINMARGPQEEKLNVYLLLDRSGSMGGARWTEAVGGVNGYIEELQKNKTEGQLSLIAFDSNGYEVLRDKVKISEVKALGNEIYPRGGTPLYRSAIRAFSDLFKDDFKRSVMVILTDGQDTDDHTGDDRKEAKSLMEAAEKKEWDVIFLGANFDVEKHYGQTVGAAMASSFTMDEGTSYSNVMRDLALKNSSYASNGTRSAWSVGEKMALRSQPKGKTPKV